MEPTSTTPSTRSQRWSWPTFCRPISGGSRNSFLGDPELPGSQNITPNFDLLSSLLNLISSQSCWTFDPSICCIQQVLLISLCNCYLHLSSRSLHIKSQGYYTCSSSFPESSASQQFSKHIIGGQDKVIFHLGRHPKQRQSSPSLSQIQPHTYTGPFPMCSQILVHEFQSS